MSTIFRQLSGHRHGLARNGVFELQSVSVQKHAFERNAQTAFGDFFIFFKVAILVIPHQGVSSPLRMDADLMRTTGFQINIQIRNRSKAINELENAVAWQPFIIIDTDSFGKKDLEKALFTLENPFSELGIKNEVISVPITSICKESLKDSQLDNKAVLRCKNMFALGLVCWLFNRDITIAEKFLREKFAKKPLVADANIKVLNDGYNYGANTHASTSLTYKIESKTPKQKGRYTDINGNKATAYGLIAAAEKAGLELYLGSYPITPATDILHELAKHKSLGIKTVQCEDEIAGCSSAIGAAFAGDLAVTTTSGPGICLKSMPSTRILSWLTAVTPYSQEPAGMRSA